MLLFAAAVIFRQRLENVQARQVEETLDGDWKALKGYLRIEWDQELGKYAGSWYYSDEDPDETTIVLDIKKVYVITDLDGNIIRNAVTKELEVSTIFDDIGVDRQEIQAQVKEALAAKNPKIFLTEKRQARGRPGTRFAPAWSTRRSTARLSTSPSERRWHRTPKSFANSPWCMSPSSPAPWSSDFSSDGSWPGAH